MLIADHSAYSIVSASNIYASTILRLHLEMFLSFRSPLLIIYLTFSLVIFNISLTLLLVRSQKMLLKLLKLLETFSNNLSTLV